MGACEADLDRFLRLRHSEREIDRLFLAETSNHVCGLLRLETSCFRPHRVGSRLQLREVEASPSIAVHTALKSSITIDDGNGRPWQDRVAGICNLPQDRAGRLALRPQVQLHGKDSGTAKSRETQPGRKPLAQSHGFSRMPDGTTGRPRLPTEIMIHQEMLTIVNRRH